jgi:hypothetical protein
MCMIWRWLRDSTASPGALTLNAPEVMSPRLV